MGRSGRSWQDRNARIVGFVHRLDVIVLVAAMLLTWRAGRFAALWILPAALLILGVVRFVIWSTGIMRCPHCDGLLWDLHRRVDKISFCPYCGEALED